MGGVRIFDLGSLDDLENFVGLHRFDHRYVDNLLFPVLGCAARIIKKFS